MSLDGLELLQAEMREITTGIQNIVPALATADWATIAQTSEKIRASYIMEKSLTPAQLEELEHQLPEPFKQRDAEFHLRAAKLGAAAAAPHSELVVFIQKNYRYWGFVTIGKYSSNLIASPLG